MKMFRLVFLTTILSFTCQIFAQEKAFDEMTLEELVNTRLTRMTPRDIHHTHVKGEWMFSYRFMAMSMDGNRDGTDQKSEDDVLNDFMVTPTNMTMQMHMIGMMYAPTNKLTLMAMIPFKQSSMDHLMRNGNKFTTESGGIGDFKLSGLFTAYENEDKAHRIVLKGGIGIPTGSIDEKDDLPIGPDQKLPYPMQISSGTYDPILSVTYLGLRDTWSWGAHVNGTFRIGENNNDYALGNNYIFTVWSTRSWNDWLTSTARFDNTIWGNYSGADPDLNPKMVPTADPDRRGGQRVQFAVGLSVFIPDGSLSGNQFSLEISSPLYQDLDGPQLESDSFLNIGWAWVF